MKIILRWVLRLEDNIMIQFGLRLETNVLANIFLNLILKKVAWKLCSEILIIGRKLGFVGGPKESLKKPSNWLTGRKLIYFI